MTENITENITVDMTNLSEAERKQLLALITKANQKWEIPKDLKPGDTFKDIDGDEWILLYCKTLTRDACILKKESLKEMQFGEDNNYNGSDIDKFLTNTYLKELERKFGKEVLL